MTDVPTRLPQRRVWTLDDLDELPEDGRRYEISHGSLLVSPAPVVRHASVAARLHRKLIFLAPPGIEVTTTTLAIELIDVPEDYTLYEPDLLVVDAAALHSDDEGRVLRPKDVLMVVEVASPSTARVDRTIKRADYARAGFEYWMVDPRQRTLHVLRQPQGTDYAEDVLLRPGQVWRSETPFPLVIDPAEITGLGRPESGCVG